MAPITDVTATYHALAGVQLVVAGSDAVQLRNAGDMVMVAADTTDDRLVAMWLGSGKRADSPATQAAYRRHVGMFFATVGKPLQAVNLEDVQTWARGLTGALATVRVRMAAVRSLFSFAVKVGYLRFNVGALLEPPSVSHNVRSHVVPFADVVRLLDAAQTPVERALVHVAYVSGARVSELLALRWRDVFPSAEPYIYIEKGKGKRSRDAGISTAALESLETLRAADSGPNEYVFATRTGKPLNRSNVHRMLERMIKRAGLRGVAADASMHWLRHTCATHALAAGANPADVAAQLGHASLATTTRYAHPQARACDALAL